MYIYINPNQLLPAHLHDEIESAPPRYNSHGQDRPGSGHEMTDPRSIQYGTQSKIPYDTHREYTVSRDRMNPGHAMRLSESASRGPSPILPSIRDLDPMSGRSNQPGYERAPRSEPFTQDYHQPGPAPMAAMPDRRSTEQYPPIMHPQSPYGPPPQMGYGGEQVSPQMMAHGQQANFGVMGDSIDPKTKRRRGNLPKPVTDILRAWFHEHLDHPYPSEEDKQMFMTRTGLSISQVRVFRSWVLGVDSLTFFMQISNWFINARRRQLPALRNQMRSGTDVDSQRQSPFSDMDGDLPSPN